MQGSQSANTSKIIRLASRRERLIALGMSLSIVALFGLLWYLQEREFDFSRLFDPCGFKQRTGWPCPGCGMTRSVLAFARGDVLMSFYCQPAAAMMCSVLVAAVIFAFPVAVLGVYFRFFDRIFHELKIGHLVVGGLVILAAGWAVTLARALAEQSAG